MRHLPKVLSLTSLILLFGRTCFSQANFWQPTGVIGGGEVKSIAIFSNGLMIVATADSELYKSTNDGNTWVKMNRIVPTLPRSNTQSLFIHPNGYIFVSRTWGTLEAGGIFFSSDSGNTWTHGDNSYGDWGSIGVIQSGDLMAVGNLIRKSTNMGGTWEYSGVGSGNDNPYHSLAVSDQGFIFVGGHSNGVYRSSNNGILWTPTTLSGVGVNSLITFPGGIVVAGTEGVGIWRSTDNATNWDTTSTGISWYYRAFAKDSSGVLYAGKHNNNVYKLVKSTDTGRTWSEMSSSGFTSREDSAVLCLAISPTGYLFAGTFSGKVFKSSQPVSDATDFIQAPSTFSMYQSFPNPFNPQTEIRYVVAGLTNIRVVVFDVLGRQIATLVDEVKDPGVYSVKWNASELPSGIYLYRMTAGKFADVKKTILLK